MVVGNGVVDLTCLHIRWTCTLTRANIFQRYWFFKVYTIRPLFGTTTKSEIAIIWGVEIRLLKFLETRDMRQTRIMNTCYHVIIQVTVLKKETS